MKRKLLLWMCLCAILVACGEKKKTAPNTSLLLPSDSEVIYRINQKNHFLSAIENNLFWKENSLKSIPPDVIKIIKTLPDSSQIWISFTEKDLFISTLSVLDSTSIWKKTTNEIQSSKIGNINWQHILVGQQLVISTSDSLETFAERSLPDNHPLPARLLPTSDPNSIANVYLHKVASKSFFETLFDTDITKPFDDWLAFDIFLDDNNIRLSGTAFAEERNKDAVFRTQPYQTDPARWLPADADAIVSYTFADASTLSLPDSLELPLQQMLNGITFAQTQGGKICLLSTYDGLESMRLMSVLSEEIEPNYSLYELASDPAIRLIMKPFNIKIKPKWIGRTENMLYISDSKETIQKTIGQVLSGRTLANNNSYAELEKEMASSVSVTRIVNLKNNTNYHKNHPKIANTYRWATLQLTPQSNYYILNFISKKLTETHEPNQIQERFSFAFDAKMITPPTIVLNHRSKRKEIVVQDENFDLYLIGNNGSLLWKKRLDGKIQSPVYQVDLFKNGYLQMAFTTEHSLWVVDRNGKNVAPFPKRYSNPITPLEVTDYEGNLDYRFLFVENKKLHLLDKKGIEVGGFSHRIADGTPLHTPKHFRTHQKDYLVYANREGALKILHRNGEIRIPVNQKFEFSDNPPTLWNDQFVLSTRNGSVLYIDLNGKLSQTKEEWNENHHLTANKYLFVQLGDNILSINGKHHTIPDGNYSVPKLFRLKGKNYIASLNQTTSQLYLWNGNGQPIQHFPTEAVVQTDINTDNEQIWIAVGKSETELIVLSTDSLITNNE